MHQNVKDITGQQFGRLTAIEYSHTENRMAYWKCLCSCGNTHTTGGKDLRLGRVVSCGCKHRDMQKSKMLDLTGKRIGKLVVKEYVGEIKPRTRANRGHAWLCICDCGNEKIISHKCLRYEDVNSCGCLQKSRNGLSTDRKAYKKFLRENPFYRLRAAIGAAVRNALKGMKAGKSVFAHLPYTLDDLRQHFESLWEPWMNWDNYGGLMQDKRKTWHIDHIIPQTAFSFTSMEDEQFLQCWALENLRPLDKIENVRKGNRIIIN